MTEENKKDQPPRSSKAQKPVPLQQIEDQEKKVADLGQSLEKDSSDETRLKYDRELDYLRHLRQAQKDNPGERAKAKAVYAAKAARNRAIQPVEQE
ncbi:MAG: hypothetical protein DWQ47_08905 [Acidobacteria bacterium]|nr:MAG: hypothetical protein DWQ32_17005 [Acidobacteriota bacterium]REJ98977.1 MAG: hypothetical protein DWQ38_12975 [Acidobacteriota bacterium]REK16303.1 MAG: hypothetical protein DWQ43_04715 [Acidobacteriota bacterium]REK43984.1 MAG: hypothetical protein DWQ47_08905 [Acidobacteriota bacterium]